MAFTESSASPRTTSNHSGVCVACMGEIEGEAKLVAGSPICEDCIRTGIIPQFYDALKTELKHPVKWGTDELQPGAFYEYFDDWDSFFKTWLSKDSEYKKLRSKRLYCRECGSYIREKPYSPHTEDNLTAECKKCGTIICGACGSDGHSANNCPKKDEPEEDALAGVANAKRCPKCDTAFYLHDGCNEVTCLACKAVWCWCCMKLQPRRDHWAPGQPCPKWNQAGDEDAQWLDPDDDSEEEVEEEALSPEVEIPPEVTDFVPATLDHPLVMDFLSELAFLDLFNHEDVTSREALQAHRALLGLPGIDPERRGRTPQERQERAFGAVTTFGEHANATMDEILREEDKYLAMDRHGENLELAVNDHIAIIRSYPRVFQSRELLDVNFFLFVIAEVHLRVMPERLLVAASDRHRFRIHMMWEPEDAGEDAEAETPAGDVA
ncbi:uncharacterized protein LTR77_003452 [Saxophila tyrrhenica]|uniref:CCHC-type domain-containing protein n=1 Tax=Saxophila tyrrhenica TaxID=1690608 RepID=A0AAV9PDU1_9PEZI|nr:hypothetical protein LTR77_003452 [Saxophila tyrrhenica]